MELSSSEVLKQWLLDEGLGVDPEVDPTSDYPIYVNFLPDEDRVNRIKSKAIAVYDGVGIVDGRCHRDGTTLIHPGNQFLIRDTNHRNGHAKAFAISTALDKIVRTLVLLDGDTYKIQAAHRQPILSLGTEDDRKRRVFFTVNLTSTIHLEAVA